MASSVVRGTRRWVVPTTPTRVAAVAGLAVALVVVPMTWPMVSVGPNDLDRSLPLRPTSGSLALGLSGLASSVGSSPVRTAILAVALTALVVVRRWRAVGLVAVSVALVHVADRVAKALVGRPRPLDPHRGHALSGSIRLVLIAAILVIGTVAVARLAGRRAWLIVPIYGASLVAVRLIGVVPVRGGDDSYPSGHASNTMALFLLLVLVRPPGRVWNRLAVAGAVLVVAIGVSRVTLGFHYPTDVLAGWCLATATILILRPAFHLERDGAGRTADHHRAVQEPAPAP